MAGKRRNIVGSEVVSQPELLYIINKIPVLDYKALACFLYLTGARVSEIVKSLKVKQITIATIQDQDFIIINGIECLKRKAGNEAVRTIPINVKREIEFIEPIKDYIAFKKDEDYLFNFSRQRAWVVIKQHTGLWCHYFRHLRNTHLATIYNFDSEALRKFNGWTDSKPASYYVHLRYDDLARKML